MGEYIASGVADERFLPVIEADASEIVPGLYLGSEANAKDVVWLKVRGISRIVTINSNPLDIFSEDCSESLKVWLKTNVKRLYVQALDSPTQTVTQHLARVFEFIAEGPDSSGVLVHCGRGISRSATLVIAYLMHRDKIDYATAFQIVSSKRPSVYPNIGFQIQLCLFEREGLKSTENQSMDLAAEVAVSIQRTLRNVEEQMDAMFDDESLTENERRWMDFGFFFQNCREYLGHVDIGLPRAVVDTARDVSRRLQNLELVFQGAGVKMAARVGRVMATFQTLQSHMSALPGAMPRLDIDNYVSVIQVPHHHETTSKNDEDEELPTKNNKRPKHS